MQFLESFFNSRKNKSINNASIIVGVSIYLILFMFLARFCFGEEQVEKTMQYGDVRSVAPPVSQAPKEVPQEILNRVIDMNGVVGIDGSLRVLEQTYVKVFDLVETSTPVVAGTNHARMFLRADGAKQSLIIGWDDGTYTKIAGN